MSVLTRYLAAPALITQLQQQVSKLMSDFTTLQADVTALLAVIPNAATLITTLHDELRLARAVAGIDPNGAAEQALDAQVKAGLAQLQAAVAPPAAAPAA